MRTRYCLPVAVAAVLVVPNAVGTAQPDSPVVVQ